MTEHGLAGIHLTENPRRPIVQCLCGAIASGVPGAEWDVVVGDDGVKSRCRQCHEWASCISHICDDCWTLLLLDMAAKDV